jgi:hypothetical protein
VVELIAGVKKMKKWTLDECKNIALKYNRPSEWQKSVPNSYNASLRRGWIEECTSHMTKRKKWTLDECKNIALKYNNITEWRKSDIKSYIGTRRRGWIEECTSHMKRRRTFRSKGMTKLSSLGHKNKFEWMNSERIAS